MKVEEVLQKHIAETILFSNIYPYSNAESFTENGVLDSMNVIELVAFLERQFGVQVADHEIIPDNFDSISKMAAFVRSKQQVAA